MARNKQWVYKKQWVEAYRQSIKDGGEYSVF